MANDASVLQVMKIADEIAPQYLKLGYDKVGLQVGSRMAAVNKILLTLEITDAVVQEARSNGANLIISHHPLIFESLDRVVEEDHVGSIVTSLIRSKISVLVAHTNLDRAENGVSEVLARALNLQDIEILQPSTDIKMFKIVVFVPEENVENLVDALGSTGAGAIGDYKYCSFRSSGTGTFLPGSEAKPHIGNIGELNQTPEVRLETLVAPDKINAVVEKMLDVHPYEEVAYDVYEVVNPQTGIGLGRIGSLSEPKELDKCVKLWEEKLGCSFRVAGDLKKRVKRVAVVGGSGADLISLAGARGADVLVTGDVKHHAAHAALEIGLAVIDAGHAETERLMVPELAKLLQIGFQKQALNIDVMISEVDTNPWCKM